MKIGLFPACLGKNDAGPETYERELIAHIATLAGDPHEYHVYCFNAAARQAVNGQSRRLNVHTLWPGLRAASMSLSLPWLLARHGVRVYHATFVPAPFCSTPAVFTMHDASPFTHPQFYPDKIRRRLVPLIRRGLKTAKLILCVSEHCRQSTRELFHLPEEKLKVVHHGVSACFHPVEPSWACATVEQRFGIRSPYLLYVGKLEARKNIRRLLEAFHQFRHETRSEMKLVLAGRRFWDLEDFDQTIAALGLAPHVVELGYVREEDLLALYGGASLLVFPTLWEGFGFPVLEAMKCGTPVVTSNISCLPEIAGGAAELVNPMDVAQIARAMAFVTSNSEARSEMIRKGLAQASRFSWEATAKQTVELYQQAAEL
jgi:glycosyltransferase involved in cell wall biosynthesis